MHAALLVLTVLVSALVISPATQKNLDAELEAMTRVVFSGEPAAACNQLTALQYSSTGGFDEDAH